VEDLQGNRNLPVYLLSELVKQLPDGVYINSMKQDNQTVLISGVAQSNERVSELLRNLANNSPWLTRPELVEITAGTVALSPRDQRRVSNFSMRMWAQARQCAEGARFCAGRLAQRAAPAAALRLPAKT
jgi:type IV pilus assembly protein PilN